MSGRDVATALTRRAAGMPAAATALTRAPAPARKDETSSVAPTPVRDSGVRTVPQRSTTTAPLRIEVGRLTLDGLSLSAGEQRLLLPVIEGELARLQHASGRDDAPQAGARERVHAPALPLAATGSVVALGIGIARSLHAGLRERGTPA